MVFFLLLFIKRNHLNFSIIEIVFSKETSIMIGAITCLPKDKFLGLWHSIVSLGFYFFVLINVGKSYYYWSTCIAQICKTPPPPLFHALAFIAIHLLRWYYHISSHTYGVRVHYKSDNPWIRNIPYAYYTSQHPL